MMRLVPPLTERRIRFEAILLGLFVWTSLIVTLAGRNGYTDFLQFYTQGKIALQRSTELLYDGVRQTALAHQFVPGSQDVLCIPVHPPQVSMLFSIFARMTYWHAQLLWWLITCAGYGFCCYKLWIACPNLHRYRAAVSLASASFPGLLILIKFGQTSVIALAAFTWAFLCLRSNRKFAAGLAIGLLAYKPQLGLVAAGIFLLTGAWRVVAGALITGLGQYALACWWYRKLVVLDFLSVIGRVGHLDVRAYEPKEWAMYSLRTFWRMLLQPSSALAFPLYVATALGVFLYCLRIWKSANPLPLRFAAFLLATVLVNPHLYIYDLVILAPALMLMVDWWLGTQMQSNRVFTVLLYLTYGSTLVVGLAANNFVSLSFIAVSAALLGFLYLRTTGFPAKAFATAAMLPSNDPGHAPSLSERAG